MDYILQKSAAIIGGNMLTADQQALASIAGYAMDFLFIGNFFYGFLRFNIHPRRMLLLSVNHKLPLIYVCLYIIYIYI